MLALLILLTAPMLVPGSSSIYADNGIMWAGPSMCVEAGFIPAAPEVADGGEITPLHCPLPGPDSSGCIEWLGAGPAIGACDPLIGTGTVPNAPEVLEIQ